MAGKSIIRHPEPQAKDLLSRLEAAPAMLVREHKRVPAKRFPSSVSHLAQQGFTLVELVAAIVVLGIVAVGLGNIMGNATRGYLQANQRSEMSAIGRFAVERISRELRTALPGSIRINNDANSQCLEFLPIVDGSTYLNLPIAPISANSFDAVPFAVAGSYIAVNAQVPADVYVTTGNVRRLWPYANTGASAIANAISVNFPAAVQFAENAANNTRRFYVLANPVSFCITNAGLLTRHTGYGLNANQTNLPNAGDLLANNLLLNSLNVFAFTAGNLQRNAIVTIAVTVTNPPDNDEVVSFTHQVMIRNVP